MSCNSRASKSLRANRGPVLRNGAGAPTPIRTTIIIITTITITTPIGGIIITTIITITITITITIITITTRITRAITIIGESGGGNAH